MSAPASPGASRFQAGLTALVPGGWLVRESVELASPTGEARVAASVDLVGPETSLEEYAGMYGEALVERLPQYEEVRVEPIAHPAGGRALLRRFRWTPEDAEAVGELQLYTLAGGRGVCATASTTETGLARLEPQLRSILLGFSLPAGPSPGGLVRFADDPRNRTYAAFERGELATTLEQVLGGGGSDGTEREAWRSAREAWERAGRP
jgi:hypothetical protein